MGHASARERNATKLLRDVRFDSFEFFGRNRPSLFFFDQVIEQEFAAASCAPVSESFSREFALQLRSTIGGIRGMRSADEQIVANESGDVGRQRRVAKVLPTRI